MNVKSELSKWELVGIYRIIIVKFGFFCSFILLVSFVRFFVFEVWFLFLLFIDIVFFKVINGLLIVG